MSTASIRELRKVHTRARAQLARAAVRYGKRALARRGSAEAMIAAAREHRVAANWQPQQQPWSGVAGANPDPMSGLWWAAFGVETASVSGDPAATVAASQALREAAIVVCERGPNPLHPGQQGG